MSTTTFTRLIAAILLFVALVHLPIGYYTFMRIAVTGLAVYNAYEARTDVQKLWMIFFIIAAIVFNPIIPIYLRHKSSWIPIDTIFGIVFLLTVLRETKRSNKA
jgi:hypothetical protein